MRHDAECKCWFCIWDRMTADIERRQYAEGMAAWQGMNLPPSKPLQIIVSTPSGTPNKFFELVKQADVKQWWREPEGLPLQSFESGNPKDISDRAGVPNGVMHDE